MSVPSTDAPEPDEILLGLDGFPDNGTHVLELSVIQETLEYRILHRSTKTFQLLVEAGASAIIGDVIGDNNEHRVSLCVNASYKADTLPADS